MARGGRRRLGGCLAVCSGVVVALALAAVYRLLGPVALIWGAETGREGLVRAALFLRVDVNAQRRPFGNTMVRLSVQTPPSHLPRAHRSRWLRQQSVRVFRPPPRTALWEAVHGGRIAMAELLLDQGADPDLGSGDERPAEMAVRHRDLAMIRVLVDHGASLGAGGSQGRTLLHQAASTGDVATARFLLRLGSDINTWDKNSWTPLTWATYQGRTDMVRFLLDRGADVNGKGHPGPSWMYHKYMTPLHIAKSLGHAECARLLKSRGGEDEVVRNPYVDPNQGPSPDHRGTQQQLLFAQEGYKRQAQARQKASP